MHHVSQVRLGSLRIVLKLRRVSVQTREEPIVSEHTDSVVKQTVEAYGAFSIISLLAALITFVIQHPELKDAFIDLLKRLGILNSEGSVVNFANAPVPDPNDVVPVEGE